MRSLSSRAAAAVPVLLTLLSSVISVECFSVQKPIPIDLKSASTPTIIAETNVEQKEIVASTNNDAHHEALPSKWYTKIVATIGPASENRLEELILAGMDVCRLNFSHGKHEEHKEIFDCIRTLSAKYNEQVAILCDIQGPKIRTGLMEAPFYLNQDDTIRVTSDEIVGNDKRIQIQYDEKLLQDLHIGDIIFINDGIVKLEVIEKDEENRDLVCQCINAGNVSDRKGVNLPSGELSVNTITPKDAADLQFIAKLNPEYVAASFVSCGNDIKRVRARLEECGNTEIKIVAKIERPVALENLDEIIAASDAIMVARGDLGVEIDIWECPMWQKEIVKRCNTESRPVIMATQMLESMVRIQGQRAPSPATFTMLCWMARMP